MRGAVTKTGEHNDYMYIIYVFGEENETRSSLTWCLSVPLLYERRKVGKDVTNKYRTPASFDLKYINCPLRVSFPLIYHVDYDIIF